MKTEARKQAIETLVNCRAWLNSAGNHFMRERDASPEGVKVAKARLEGAEEMVFALFDESEAQQVVAEARKKHPITFIDEAQ